MFFKKEKITQVIKHIFFKHDTDIKKGYNKMPVELEQIKQAINLKAGQKLVFEKLVFYCYVIKGARGFTTVSIRKLAQDLGMHINGISKIIKILDSKKLIKSEIIEPQDPRNRSKTKNRYRLITIAFGEIKILTQKFT